MKFASSRIFTWIGCALAAASVGAQDADPALVKQAKALSNARSEATFVRQCTVEPARFPGLGEGVATAPVKLFDNLYYVGRTDVGAWVIKTSDGLALIDTLYTPQDAENIIIPGMRKLGLNPDDLKVVFVTHFHGDHSGGVPYFQQRGVRVMLSQADWASMPSHAAPNAASVASDGQVITLGDTPITVVFTPGHTPGAISLIFPVFENGTRHTAVVMELSPRGGLDVHREAVAGIRHLGEYLVREKVDIALHPHEMIFDPAARDFIMTGAKLAARQANPLVIGAPAVQRFGQMVDMCWQARIATMESRGK
jgi:metallo-beta-lactamase class B